MTPLHTAARSNRGASVAELLIRSGADVNAKDEASTLFSHHIDITRCSCDD